MAQPKGFRENGAAALRSLERLAPGRRLKREERGARADEICESLERKASIPPLDRTEDDSERTKTRPERRVNLIGEAGRVEDENTTEALLLCVGLRNASRKSTCRCVKGTESLARDAQS